LFFVCVFGLFVRDVFFGLLLDGRYDIDDLIVETMRNRGR